MQTCAVSYIKSNAKLALVTYVWSHYDWNCHNPTKRHVADANVNDKKDQDESEILAWTIDRDRRSLVRSKYSTNDDLQRFRPSWHQAVPRLRCLGISVVFWAASGGIVQADLRCSCMLACTTESQTNNFTGGHCFLLPGRKGKSLCLFACLEHSLLAHRSHSHTPLQLFRNNSSAVCVNLTRNLFIFTPPT